MKLGADEKGLLESVGIEGNALRACTRRATVIPSTCMKARSWSCHADFNGTLEYIRATGAKRVITDNTLGHGIELALAIKHRLGIDALPSSNLQSHQWGVG